MIGSVSNRVAAVSTIGRDPNRTSLPPHNIEAEQAFLGAVLTNGAALDHCAELLGPDDFYHPVHGGIWSEMLARYRAGVRQINPVSLKDWADRHLPAEVGGAGYLVDLFAAAVTIAGAPEYARIIAELAHRRRLIDIGLQLADDASQSDFQTPATDIQATAEAALLAAVSGGADARGAIPLSSALQDALTQFQDVHRAGAPSGLLFGFPDLDDLLGGIKPQELIILGGRPAQGKTALATALALGVAERGVPVAFFSMEMGAVEIAKRIVAAEGELDLARLSSGASSDREIERAVLATQRSGRLPIIFDERPYQTVATLASRARRLKRRHGVGLVVVDYLQLMDSDRKRSGTRNDDVSEISRGLKLLAKDLETPVLALAQLSRRCEERADKRPLPSDLRDSGAIEQDADKIIFVHHEWKYWNEARNAAASAANGNSASHTASTEGGRIGPRSFREARAGLSVPEPDPHHLDVLVRKNRSGREGRVVLFYDRRTQKIAPLKGDDPDAPGAGGATRI